MKTPPLLKDFIDLFFPRLCPVCQRALNRNEENICTTCLHRLPRTGYHLDPLSPMAQLFSGKFPLKNVRHFSFSPRRATPGNSYTTSNTTEGNNAVSP